MNNIYAETCANASLTFSNLAITDGVTHGNKCWHCGKDVMVSSHEHKINLVNGKQSLMCFNVNKGESK